MHTVIPSQADRVPSVNGSSPTGHCSNMKNSETIIICTAPRSSVLFDGKIPKLTGLDGNMWASRLLTLHVQGVFASVNFDFSGTAGYAGVDRVEVVIFNCSQWEMNVTQINLIIPSMLTSLNSGATINSSTPMSTSCDSLVTVNIPCRNPHCAETLLGLQFLSPSSNPVYIAPVPQALSLQYLYQTL